VFDAPEVWTNSSALFRGVEVSLYPLLAALRREGATSPAAEGVWGRCRTLLRGDATLERHLERAEQYLASPAVAPLRDLGSWPQHATPEQMDAMLAASEDLLGMSADPKNPVCAELSREVVASVGRLMLDGSWEAPAPVLWLNHDVVARRIVSPRQP
jgi:hypothetical protein